MCRWKKTKENNNKPEASSPTVTNQSVLLTATIEAKEKSCMVGVDAPNEFVNCKNEKGQKFIMKMQGKLA